MTSDEVAQLWGLPKESIEQASRTKELVAVRLNDRVIRYRAGDVADWLDRKATKNINRLFRRKTYAKKD
jgi:hypothetical protein